MATDENSKNEILKTVYYDLASPACYAGTGAILRESKKIDKNITLRDVKNFLSKQDVYTLHKPVRKRYPTNKTLSAGIGIDFQLDLADLRKIRDFNDGYGYILVCIDVFSRFLRAAPVKTKSSKDVARAFSQILKRLPSAPWRVFTDKGKEFMGEAFKELLEKKDIQHINPQNPDVKAAVAERSIRNLKNRLWRHFRVIKTKRWKEILPKIIKALNNSYHRILKTSPSKITKENQQYYFRRQMDQLKTRHSPSPKFKIGDIIRITRETHKLKHGYLPLFTEELFEIAEHLPGRIPPTYKIKDLHGEEILGVFYEPELVKCSFPPGAFQQIERVSKSKILPNGKVQHLVKFKDYARPKWINHMDLITT